MTENERSHVYLYKVVDVTENSGIEVDYRSRWSTGEDNKRGVLDSRHRNFDEFAEHLLPRLKEKAQVINGLPIRYTMERSHMRLFKLTDEGKVVRSYEPLSGEELRELQRKILEQTVMEEVKSFILHKK